MGFVKQLFFINNNKEIIEETSRQEKLDNL